MNAPGVTSLVKRVLHLAPQREMPRLATAELCEVGALGECAIARAQTARQTRAR